MRLLREARIAYLLTLQPLVLLLFSLGVTLAISFRAHVLEPLAIFTLGTIIGLPAHISRSGATPERPSR